MMLDSEPRDPFLEQDIAEFEVETSDQDDWWDSPFKYVAVHIAESGETGVNYLLSILPSADTAHTAAAFNALSQLEPPPAALQALLVNALDDKRSFVVCAAFYGLTNIQDRRHFERARQFLKHESPEVSSAALYYIAEIFPLQTIDLIESALEDERFLVRKRMLQALDDTESEELGAHAVSSAWKFMGDPHPEVRDAAAHLLHRHFWATRTPWQIAEARGNPNPFVRASAIRESVLFNIEAAPDHISTALRDPHPAVRVSALRELEHMYDSFLYGPTILELVDITPFLNDNDPIIREAAEDVSSAWERRQNYQPYVRHGGVFPP